MDRTTNHLSGVAVFDRHPPHFYSAIYKGIFRRELKDHFFRAMIFGTLSHIVSTWAIMGKEYRVVTEIDRLYDLICRAIEV
ncbi:TetR/AcrR family transcriptional regulator C-terminal domain-containing protein [Thermodesulfobacteriota bacterium]